MFILIHSEMMNTLAYNFYEMSKVRGEAVYEISCGFKQWNKQYNKNLQQSICEKRRQSQGDEISGIWNTK